MEIQLYSKTAEILTTLCTVENLPSDGWMSWIPAGYKANGELDHPEILKRRTANGVGSLTAYAFPNGKVNIKDDRMNLIASTEVIA